MLQINSFDLLEVLAYIFLWITMYFVLCLWNPVRSYEWHSRVVTMTHALVISALAIYCTLYVGPNPWTEAGGPNSPLQARILSLSLGYFVFDVGFCLYFKTEGPAMMLHHFLSCLGLSWSLLCGYYGTELMLTLGGAEITNPLLQLRWFLQQTGKYKTRLGLVVDWTFMLSFGFLRIGLGSLYLYSYFQQDTCFWGRVGAVSIYLISWLFFLNILAFAVRKYSRRSPTPVAKHNNLPLSKNGFLPEVEPCGVKGPVNIITDQDIPSQREIKTGGRGLSLRKLFVMQECIEG